MPDEGSPQARSNSRERRSGCAANCCRKAPTVRLKKGNLTLFLCDRHMVTYLDQGYELVAGGPPPGQPAYDLGGRSNVGPANRQPSVSNGERRASLPVFPFTDGQVQHVADALTAKIHWLQDDERATDLARTALKALAHVMRCDSEGDPGGFPCGSGIRRIRATTPWYIVRPDETWEPED